MNEHYTLSVPTVCDVHNNNGTDDDTNASAGAPKKKNSNLVT